MSKPSYVKEEDKDINYKVVSRLNKDKDLKALLEKDKGLTT
jgi:hypothetical protein